MTGEQPPATGPEARRHRPKDVRILSSDQFEYECECGTVLPSIREAIAHIETYRHLELLGPHDWTGFEMFVASRQRPPR